MNWEIIQSFCISISVVGAAITYIYKAVIAARKPGDTIKGQFEAIDKELDNDNQRLSGLRKDVDQLDQSLKLLLESNFTILGHLKTGNNTGKMTEMEKKIQEYLIHN